jgi:hypothetical protein
VDSLSGVVDAKTNDYTVLYTDQNKTIEFTKGTAVTCTIDAVATIIAAIDTSEWAVTIKNLGAGVCTVNPNAAETIDGLATYTLNQYESVTIQLDDAGTGWNTISNSGVSETKTQTLTNKTLTSPVLNTGVSGTAVKDEDNMASDSATHLCTQQSIKAYVDTDAVGKVVTAYCTATTTVTSTTAIDVTGMAFPSNIGAGVFAFEAGIYFESATDEIKFTFPDTNYTVSYFHYNMTAAGNDVNNSSSYNLVSPVPIVQTASAEPFSDSSAFCVIHGVMEITSGTNDFKIQIEKLTDVGTDPAVYINSWMKMTRLS